MANKMISQMWGPVNPRDFAVDVAASVTDETDVKAALRTFVAADIADEASAIRTALDANVGGSDPIAVKAPGASFSYTDSRSYYPATLTTDRALVADEVLFAPILIPVETYIDGLGITVVTTGTATHARMAIYGADFNGTNRTIGSPHNLIWETGEAAVGTTGYSSTWEEYETPLAPGFYYFAIVTNGTLTVHGLTPLAYPLAMWEDGSMNGCYQRTDTYGPFDASVNISGVRPAAPRVSAYIRHAGNF